MSDKKERKTVYMHSVCSHPRDHIVQPSTFKQGVECAVCGYRVPGPLLLYEPDPEIVKMRAEKKTIEKRLVELNKELSGANEPHRLRRAKAKEKEVIE